MDFSNRPIRVFPTPLPMNWAGLPSSCQIMVEPYFIYFFSLVPGNDPNSDILVIPVPYVRPPLYDMVAQFLVIDYNSPIGFCFSDAVRFIF